VTIETVDQHHQHQQEVNANLKSKFNKSSSAVAQTISLLNKKSFDQQPSNNESLSEEKVMNQHLCLKSNG